MTTNGEVYCDECNLAIQLQKHVRLPRPQIAGKANQQQFAHFHNRYEGDCWFKVKQKAAQRAAAKRPTQRDMSEYEKWLAFREARREVIQ